MLNMRRFKGFALIKNDRSSEADKLSLYCTLEKIPLIRVNKNEKCPVEYVPCGGVEWCELTLGQHITPDYYPMWLVATNECLHRTVWREDKWPLGKKVFIKPSDRYKRFTGFVTTGTYKKKKKPPFYCSDIVKFINEWRYYISFGKVLVAEWYWGDEKNTPPAREFPYWIPQDYCGAIDFGMTDNGKFSLIEAQHPFACGWYGNKTEIYAQWLIDGWYYMWLATHQAQELATSRMAHQIRDEVDKGILEDLTKLCEKQLNTRGYPIKREE